MKIFFYDNDSFLNRLNPLSKVVTSLPFIFLICLINEIWIPLAFIVFTAFIVLVLGRIPLIRFLKILAPISIFFISIFILFLLASRSDLTVGSPILFSIGEFHFYEYSVRLGLIYAIRIFALLILILPVVRPAPGGNAVCGYRGSVRPPCRPSHGSSGVRLLSPPGRATPSPA